MRLIGLHVDGFGKLSDFRCSFDAPITVIYGRNEAGKSTTLSFIRTMLYGFATRANPSERLEPAASGRHGGRLFFRGSEGESYVLERYANAPGRVIVRPFFGAHEAAGTDSRLEYSSSTETLPQTAWEQRFLGGVSERVFRQLFAITLTELQAIGMLEGDELGKQLYHAGWGGGAAIARTEKQLGSSLDDLFRPRGSNQQINRLLKSLEKTETELRGLEDGISKYNELTQALSATESQLQEAEGRLPGLRESAMLLARACDNWPLWVERLAMMKEKETLAMAARLPADIRVRWDLHTADRERLQGELQGLRLSIESIEREIALLSYDDKVIARADEIETLLMSVDRISSIRLERKEMEAELREHNDALARLTMRISPDWTEEQLRSLRVTVADRETVRETRAAMLEADRGLERAEAELRKVREQASETAAQIAELEAAAGTVDSRWNGDESVRPASAQEDDRRAAAERLELLPETPEALRLAARAFEDAWRELELERLRTERDTPPQTAVVDSGSESANRRGRAALWLAAGAMAAAAVLLGAAGWRTAAVAAGAAAAALAAPALLSRLRRRAARPAAPGPAAQSPAGAASRRAAQPALKRPQPRQRGLPPPSAASRLRLARLCASRRRR
ncbi:AAA family ATPase [Paenibacillus sp. sptzw28]|uniref:AAA family ATPase n=1 Tax=Paenibacillus sp. sptzw28 TaxID=715179 RepID=UPI001C6DFD1A|nr:AAA family ATPase [Paenibacillus sp. sptzw28]QYR23529.1 AAA family ATPase [Paenibacillus sp. sptzw28]